MMSIQRGTPLNWQLVAAQFHGLQGRHPGTWPIVPRLLCALGVSLMVVMAGGWLVWTSQWEELAAGQAEEVRQKQEFTEKVRQSGHLDILRQQKVRVQSQVEKLEQQLPGKSEMDALASTADCSSSCLNRVRSDCMISTQSCPSKSNSRVTIMRWPVSRVISPICSA